MVIKRRGIGTLAKETQHTTRVLSISTATKYLNHELRVLSASGLSSAQITGSISHYARVTYSLTRGLPPENSPGIWQSQSMEPTSKDRQVSYFEGAPGDFLPVRT